MMTSIKVYPGEKRWRISIHGHAGYQPGNDPVCAAISAITFQLLNVLDDYQGRGIVSDLSSEAIDGNFTADFIVKAPTVWDVAWDVIKTGYMAIAESYPENLVMDE